MTLEMIPSFPCMLRGGAALFESVPHDLNGHHLFFVEHHTVGDRVGLFDPAEDSLFPPGSRRSDINYTRGNPTLMRIN